MSLQSEDLVSYLADELNVDTTGLDSEALLFSSGLVDSFSMIDLIFFLETQCGIKLKPAEITLDNLDSIGRIMAFIQKRDA